MKPISFLFIIFVIFCIIKLMYQNKTNCNFKVVIQTHRDHKVHLEKYLKSIDYKNHLNDIILVYSDEKVYKVENKPQLPSIYSTLNIWEYTSFIEVDNNQHLENFKSNYYFFCHDTCWCDNQRKFWKNLKHIAKNTNNFYYPSSHIQKNIGMCSKLFLTKFSNELKKYGNFKRETGVKLENKIKNICKFQYIPKSYKDLGKIIIDNVDRRLHYFDYISLYKHSRFTKSNIDSFIKKY